MTKRDLLTRYRALRVSGYTPDEAARELNRKKSYLVWLEHHYRKNGGGYCKLCGIVSEEDYCSFSCYYSSGKDTGPILLARARYLTKIKLSRYNKVIHTSI